jgi:hypothetical protein
MDNGQETGQSFLADFAKCKDFTFRNKITEAGISIMNNLGGFIKYLNPKS